MRLAPGDAWTVVNGQLQATTDNGITWQPILLGYRLGSFDHIPGGGWVAADDCRGTWPCQGVLLSTADGGATWTRYALGGIGIDHVLATSTQRAWFTDGAGHWYATEDGGVACRQWR